MNEIDKKNRINKIINCIDFIISYQDDMFYRIIKEPKKLKILLELLDKAEKKGKEKLKMHNVYYQFSYIKKEKYSKKKILNAVSVLLSDEL